MQQLEGLLFGRTDSIEIDCPGETREKILEQMEKIITSLYPSCRFEGEFVNKDNSDYMIYDLHISGFNLKNMISAIRLFDFGDRFRLTRIIQ